MTDLADYHWLVGDEAARWLAECAASVEPSDRLQTQLRKSLSAERARMVVEQVALRCKATAKFDDMASNMFFTDLGMQQSTDRWIANYKANRFAQGHPVIDYCCGIGGDLVALAARGPTVGWDRSPEMTILAEANLRAIGCEILSRVELGAVEDHPPQVDEAWHLDPDRREGGRRSTHVKWHSPSEATIRDWLTRSPSAAIKLAPAAQLDSDWQARAELEWISRDRQCRQLVAWLGNLSESHGRRRATHVDMAGSHTFVGDPLTTLPLADSIGQFVYDTDPAIRAAKLTTAWAASLEMSPLTAGEGYLTSDNRIEHPLLAAFRVVDILPLRISFLVKHLRATGIGDLEIKTRGVAVRPEELRKKLKLTGSKAASLLLTRLGKREMAILAERVIAYT